MTVQLILTLDDSLYDRVQLLAQAQQQDVEEVIMPPHFADTYRQPLHRLELDE